MSRIDSSCCRKVSTFIYSVVFAGIVFATILAAPRAGIAQVLYGTLVGHVTDPSGAAVPGVKVTITDQGTNIQASTTTNSSGDYTFSTIVAGTYTLQITQQGFQTYKRTDVPVTINAVARADVTLTIGAVTQTVEVTGARPILQTDTSEVHANIDTPALSNIPVPLGRNYQQIYRAEPGFSPPSNSHSYPTNPARALSFNVNGTSNNQNNTRIDGVSTYNIQLPHVNSYVPTLDSIQQVNVVTDSFDAEEGFAGGAAINVETKSGTNQIHGDVFEYHNDNHLKSWPMLFDAADENVGNKPKYIYNDFGGSVGGPIKKDKAFFFASYEGLFNNFFAQTRGTIPTEAMRNGDLSATGTDIYDPLTGNPDGSGRQQFFATNDPNDAAHFNAACASAQCLNMIPTSRLDPIAQQILNNYIPLPNRSGLKNDYFLSGVRVFHRNQVDTKINYNVNSKFNLIGTFGMLHYINDTPTLFQATNAGGPHFGSGGNSGHGYGNTYRMTIMGTYTLTPNLLLDAHFGWAKQGTSSVQNDLGTNFGSDVLGIPGTNGPRSFESGWPAFEIHNFATIGQVDNFMPYYRHDPQKQYVAAFNWLKGPHNVRFGFEWYSQALNQTQAEDLSGGYGAQGGFHFGDGVTANCTDAPGDGTCSGTTDTSRYNGFGSFLLGLPDAEGRNFQIPDVYHVHANLYSVYVRDRWNVNKKLTADYGVRWEYYPMPARPDRGIEVYNPGNNTMNLCGFGSVPSGCGVEISKALFSPRVGFAYRLTDSFVIRAGYGMTTDPYEAMEPMRNNFPISVPTHVTNTLPAGGQDGLLPVCFTYNNPVNPTACSTYRSLELGIPAIATPDLGNGVVPIPLDVAYAGYPPKKFDRGYVQSWNFTVQKELKWGFTGQVGYVATRQTRILGFLDTNAGQVIGAGSAGQPLFAAYGRTAPTINIAPVGSGHYDAVQAVLSRRFAKGLMLQVNYTYSKAIASIDNSDGSPGDDRLQVQRLMYLNQTVTGFDRTHNLQILHVWELPFGKGRKWLSGGGVGSFIAGGWQLSGLASFISGPPFSVYSDGTGFNTPGSNQTADQIKPSISKIGAVGAGEYFYDPSAFANPGAARLGTTGFNILRASGIGNYDFSVSREFNLTERFRLQFRMDAFNFTNTPHFDVPDNSLSDANAFNPVTGAVTDPGDFMTVTSVNSLAREGIDERQFEFGLKLFF
ncbi:MAG TPA: TonB-dependent receptor [Terriglobales bacterium]|nr:TonB-dependent receptor [Terriglobales bacterium]